MVYLLHFDGPYHHARHYMGYSEDVESRIKAHSVGQGARLLEVVRQAGIGWVLARTWPGGRDLERRLKRWKNSPELCPICRQSVKEAVQHGPRPL